MHLDTAPYILPSEAAAAVCVQERGKRIRLYIRLLQGGGGNEYDYKSNYYKEEEENKYDYI